MVVSKYINTSKQKVVVKSEGGQLVMEWRDRDRETGKVKSRETELKRYRR